MSQVQIRQLSSKSFTTNPQLAGSWFPTGYYGHFRAKSRIDLCNDFRQLARPNPPTKFLERQNTEASTHLFSQHDNRFKFECDPLVRSTQQGFGRRKLNTNAQGKFDPFFMGWKPKSTDQNESIEDMKTTSYTHDYNPKSASSQMLVNIESIRPLSSSSEHSVYSAVYNHGQPDIQQARKIRQETFQRYSSALTRRLQIKLNERSTNVATCLIWNYPKEENKLTTITPLHAHINQNHVPLVNQQKPYQRQSVQTFKTNTMTSDENRNGQVTSSLQRAASFNQTRTNTMDHLIAKYM